MKRFIVILAVFALSIQVYGQKQAPLQKLRVLYVGGSANWEAAYFVGKPDELKADVAQRMSSFESMLKRYFTEVKVVDASTYNQSLSDQYDVTVMDGTPKAINPRQNITDASGKLTKIIPAAYLTEDFNKPMLFIGELGEKMGRSIGLKLDWYCLCLDADAHNMRKDHQIFKGPFPVKMTMVTKPTPEDAFHYEYFLGKKTPETLPMWKVQTKGYITDKNFRIGMVARPWGFEDSPDAEFISSGVCQKTLDAVALGRHGNFFHWGFAASPEFMTEEAQVVLANSIAYISKFNGKGVIARKYLDRRATREYLKERKYLVTKAAYEVRLASEEKFAKQMLAEKATAEAKKANGETLDQTAQMALNYKASPSQSYESFLKGRYSDLFDKFGTDEAAYARYFDENKDYFYSEDEMYKINIDEDVKSLGIPYYDKKILDKAIGMLESGNDVAKGKRILNRYTLVNFDTTAQWRAWFDKYKSKMFFTETGGYYFMIDTYDKTVPGNQYKKPGVQKVSYNKIQTGKTSHENAVAVATGMVDLGNNKKEIVIKFKVHSGYHMYANVAKEDPYIVTEVKINLPAGYRKVGELRMPSFNYFNDKGTTIYENEIMFVQEVSGDGKGEAVCSVSYQCCDSQICFPPVIGDKYKVEIN
ncbi:protein-disulfide reductase DsbD domain-containing protein [Pedobacter frigoris]|uniref:protein-disulfide reductase DsbD domain-containing protein n=1 Tax=Pedobacter frigoris TaxID=2571272 RepID=UPI002930B5A8|nr:protein-disulfide reductase DsbD domain-containing protein [Pedobacter frigoris]